MTSTQRGVRLFVTLAASALLLWGTVKGHDDHFPFGPFRMYANRSRPSGIVTVPVLEGVTSAGKPVRIPPGLVHLRRAEIEGQIPYFIKDPARMRHFADVYNKNRPAGSERVEGIRIYKKILRLEDFKVVRRETRTMATWGRRSV